jgi:hypothetical protein
VKVIHSSNSPVRCLKLLALPNGDEVLAVGHQDGTLCLHGANCHIYLTGEFMKYIHSSNSPVRCLKLLALPTGDEVLAVGHQDGTLCLHGANCHIYLPLHSEIFGASEDPGVNSS